MVIEEIIFSLESKHSNEQNKTCINELILYPNFFRQYPSLQSSVPLIF